MSEANVIEVSSNLGDMTLSDVEFIEEYTGKTVDDIFIPVKGPGGKLKGVKIPAKTMTALAFVEYRRENPEADLETFKASTKVKSVTLVADPPPEADA